MAKKADLLEKAAELKLSVTEKNTIAEIEAAIAEAEQPAPKTGEKSEDKDVIAEREATVAKAGKRSQKAIEEAEAKAEKEARKEAGDTTPQDEDAEAHVKKGPKPVTRPRLERRGKKYQEAAQKMRRARCMHLRMRSSSQPKPAQSSSMPALKYTFASALTHDRPTRTFAPPSHCHTAPARTSALLCLRQKKITQVPRAQVLILSVTRHFSSSSTRKT